MRVVISVFWTRFLQKLISIGVQRVGGNSCIPVLFSDELHNTRLTNGSLEKPYSLEQLH